MRLVPVTCAAAAAASLLAFACSAPAPSTTAAPTSAPTAASSAGTAAPTLPPAPTAIAVSSPTTASASPAPAVSPAAVPSPSAAAGAQTMEPLAIGMASTSANQLPTWIALDQGLFAKNGLKVSTITIAGGNSPTAALISGQIQVLRIATEAISADLNGANLVYVAAPSSSVSFWLFTNPKITTPEQLKGKKVAVTGIGTATYTAARMALQSMHLDPAKDVTIISAKSVPAIFAAIQSGGVDAGVLSMPVAEAARKAGLHEMVDVAKLGIPFPSSWDAFQRSYVQQHPDVVTKYIRTIAEAMSYERTHPQEAQAILGKYTKTTDPTVLKASYDAVAPYLLKVPAPNTAAVKNALKEIAATNPKAATADPASFIDPSFVNQLQTSGFFSSLP